MKITRKQLRSYLGRILNESNTIDQGSFLVGSRARTISVPLTPQSSSTNPVDQKNGKFIIDISSFNSVTNPEFINALASGLGASGGEANMGQYGEQLLLTLKPYLGDFDSIEDTNKWVSHKESLFGTPTGAGDSFGIDAFAYTSGNRFAGKSPDNGLLDFSDLGVGISMKFSTRVGDGSYNKQKSTMYNNDGMVKLACLYGMHWLFENNLLGTTAPTALKDPDRWVDETINQLQIQGVTSIKVKVDAINSAPRPQDPLVNQDITLDSGRSSLNPPPTANFYLSLKEMLANAEATYGQSSGSIRINAKDGSDLNQPLNLTIPAAAQDNIRNYNPAFLTDPAFKTKLGVIIVGDMIARMADRRAGNFAAAKRSILDMSTQGSFSTSTSRTIIAANGKTMRTIAVEDYINLLMPKIQSVFAPGNRASEQKPVISLVSTSELGTPLGREAIVNLTNKTSMPPGIGASGDLKDPQSAKIEIILPAYKDLNLEFSDFITSAGSSAIQQMRSSTGGQPASFQPASASAAYDASEVYTFDPTLVDLSQPVQNNIFDAIEALKAVSLKINTNIQQAIVDRAIQNPGIAPAASRNAILSMLTPAPESALQLKAACQLFVRNLLPLADELTGLGPSSSATGIHYNQSKSKAYEELIKLVKALIRFDPKMNSMTGAGSIDEQLTTRIGKLTSKINSPKVYKGDVNEEPTPGLTHSVIDGVIATINLEQTIFSSLGLLKTAQKLSSLSSAFAKLKTDIRIQAQNTNPPQIYMLAEDINILSDILNKSTSPEGYLAAKITKAEVIAAKIANQIIQIIGLFEIVTKIEVAFTPTRITISQEILKDLANYIDLINTELSSENEESTSVIDIKNYQKDPVPFGQEERTAAALNKNSNKPILKQVAETKIYESILRELMKYSK